MREIFIKINQFYVWFKKFRIHRSLNFKQIVEPKKWVMVFKMGCFITTKNKITLSKKKDQCHFLKKLFLVIPLKYSGSGTSYSQPRM